MDFRQLWSLFLLSLRHPLFIIPTVQGTRKCVEICDHRFGDAHDSLATDALLSPTKTGVRSEQITTCSSVSSAPVQILPLPDSPVRISDLRPRNSVERRQLGRIGDTSHRLTC